MFLEHLIYPVEKFLSFGMVYYFFYPLLPVVSPILGISGVSHFRIKPLDFGGFSEDSLELHECECTALPV